MNGKSVVLLDEKSIPNQLTIDDLVRIKEDKKVILWDSRNEGQKPQIITAKGFISENLIIIDTSSPEGQSPLMDF